MPDFRTFQNSNRGVAIAMQQVQDPAGWLPESLGRVRDWAYRFSAADRSEIIAAVDAFRAAGEPLINVSRENFSLGPLADLMGDVRRELLDGRGMVMMQNFPIDELDREGAAIAYLGLGSYLGHKMAQNKYGHVLGHVKNLGEDYGTTGRSYNTNAEIRFHSDACDYVGLLCLQKAKSGGASRVGSSVTIYNKLLERRPDLVEVLTQDFYRSHNGEMSPGESPWFKQPIFSFTEGYFSAIGAGSTIEKALRLPGVPPLTAAQEEAIKVYREIVSEFAADMDFEPGDIQFLNNYVTLHSRRHFEDWPEPNRRRHLLRLWLRDPAGRPIPKAQREGRHGKGVQIAGMRLVAPLDAAAA
jgi:Taurine catabolism dioxygenase TauD, TfdA family